jgi:hypothetical protein
MPWITIILSMAAASNPTLAAIQYRVWLHVRDSPAGILFSVAAGAATATAWIEARDRKDGGRSPCGTGAPGFPTASEESPT